MPHKKVISPFHRAGFSYMKRNIGLTLDNDLINKIDSARGLAPRSAVIEKILWKSIEHETNSSDSAGKGGHQ
jgi:hypothetical protein